MFSAEVFFNSKYVPQNVMPYITSQFCDNFQPATVGRNVNHYLLIGSEKSLSVQFGMLFINLVTIIVFPTYVHTLNIFGCIKFKSTIDIAIAKYIELLLIYFQ